MLVCFNLPAASAQFLKDPSSRPPWCVLAPCHTSFDCCSMRRPGHLRIYPSQNGNDGDVSHHLPPPFKSYTVPPISWTFSKEKKIILYRAPVVPKSLGKVKMGHGSPAPDSSLVTGYMYPVCGLSWPPSGFPPWLWNWGKPFLNYARLNILINCWMSTPGIPIHVSERLLNAGLRCWNAILYHSVS